MTVRSSAPGHPFGMPLRELVRSAADTIGDRNPWISGLTLDSRQVGEGDAFVALVGAQHNGMQFAEDAADRGCAAILFDPAQQVFEASSQCSDAVVYVAVPDLRDQLGELASRFYGYPSHTLKVVGVTGTNGKTSCVHLLAQALKGEGVEVATIGTLGSGSPGELIPELNTTPDAITIQRNLSRFLSAGTAVVPMEVSSIALEQGRVNGVEFAIAALTNLTHDHLDYHQTMEAYGASKAMLFKDHPVGAAVINVEDEFGASLAQSLPTQVRLLTYGVRSGDIRAEQIATTNTGLRFRLVTSQEKRWIESSLVGRFNVANLLAVAACLCCLDWSMDRVAAALRQVRPVPGRMESIGGGSLPLVVIDYAHTPDALEQALGSLRPHTEGRLVCIFGCGGDRDQAKRPLMAATAERLADHIIVTDDNPRYESGQTIVDQILNGLERPAEAGVLRDRTAAIQTVIDAACAGDVVLIAGKGHETYQEIAGEKYPLSDLESAREALGVAA